MDSGDIFRIVLYLISLAILYFFVGLIAGFFLKIKQIFLYTAILLFILLIILIFQSGFERIDLSSSDLLAGIVFSVFPIITLSLGIAINYLIRMLFRK